MLSLSVHEWAHAWTAHKLGDDTARNLGRLTLNPMSHIDPMGTIILPALLVFSGSGFFFGWAQPVPISPTRFSRHVRMKTGVVLTAAAGPISNLVLALLMGLMLKFIPMIDMQGSPVETLVFLMFQINIILAVFNLIPVPPLDGNRVVVGLLPDKAEQSYYRFMEQYSFIVPLAFMALILFGGEVIQWPLNMLSEFLLTITGNR